MKHLGPRRSSDEGLGIEGSGALAWPLSRALNRHDLGLDERRRWLTTLRHCLALLPPTPGLAPLAGGTTKHLIGPPGREGVMTTGANLAALTSSPGPPLALIARVQHGSPKGATALLSRIGNARKAGRFGFSRSWAETPFTVEGVSAGAFDARQARKLMGPGPLVSARNTATPPPLSSAGRTWLRLTLAGPICFGSSAGQSIRISTTCRRGGERDTRPSLRPPRFFRTPAPVCEISLAMRAREGWWGTPPPRLKVCDRLSWFPRSAHLASCVSRLARIKDLF
jgi:hypothetical protein